MVTDTQTDMAHSRAVARGAAEDVAGHSPIPNDCLKTTFGLIHLSAENSPINLVRRPLRPKRLTSFWCSSLKT